MHDTAVYNRLPDGISGRLCGCDRRGRRIDFTSGVPDRRGSDPYGARNQQNEFHDGNGNRDRRFAKNGYIQFKKVVWFIVAALIGSSIGSNLTLLVSDKILQYMMIVILPIVAFYVMRNKKMGDDSLAGTLPERKSFLIALASALIIGIYDGFYGPGTGTFLLLVLTGAARYTMKEAAGTTKAINLSSNVAAFVTFVIHGKIIYTLGLAAAICSILGNYIGSGLVMGNGQKIVRPLILVVLAILFVKILSGN